MYPSSYFPKPTFPAEFPPGATDPGSIDYGQFIDKGISNVNVSADDTSLYVSWDADSTVPAGSIYQIYVNNVLKWEDVTTHATLPIGAGAGTSLLIHVGRVGPQNRGVDYHATLTQPVGTGNRVRLAWIGGRWMSPDLRGFRVYRSAVAGGPVDRTHPVATLPAHVGGAWGDGYGRGPYGRGAYGRGNVAYKFTSEPLQPGMWSFSIAPFDGIGREPEQLEVVTVNVQGPPSPPKSVNGKRLWISSYDPATRSVTLSWDNG